MVDPSELEPGDTIVRTREQYGSGGGTREISRTVARITEEGVSVHPEGEKSESTTLSLEQVRNKWDLSEDQL
ncbi:hypothetical protein EGH24_04530 [Halonotius terrestris]|uniref:Uncharacterized protein n=1 Tax=Halonotius terrestris TaxID=2487750 RepID=A0A8J8PCY9_9EURY|nr:hypothetical protein [Halonotius terrestris]TQQ82718.1 hypothetical protein EGH24_04530 [Halonotius terrestris]